MGAAITAELETGLKLGAAGGATLLQLLSTNSTELEARLILGAAIATVAATPGSFRHRLARYRCLLYCILRPGNRVEEFLVCAVLQRSLSGVDFLFGFVCIEPICTRSLDQSLRLPQQPRQVSLDA